LIRTPPQIPLPSPTRVRWQPLRLGLIELYHYDVEEFWFRDGHLLLRGNNGTGKSKVLSLTLPFLLDANLSASRVEPDGDRGKRMDWNLLMNKRYERRIGYAWIEFGRRENSGRILTLTLGCGLRAAAGRPSVDPWFFITEQRIGADLWLTTHEHTALSRERLIEAIGTRGHVFENAQTYRRAVDERLFRLGTERYAALVDTLIQLRQPQLSKNPDENRLSEALTQALPPLDRAALEDVAEAMSELDDIRRGLEEIEAMRKAIAAFGARYRRYAQIATRRRARGLRQAQTDYDNASRDVNAAQKELDDARAKVTRCLANEQKLDEQLAADAARLRVLQSDPVMRDAARMASARDRATECRTLTEESAARVTSARTQREREVESVTRRREQAGTTRGQLITSQSNSVALAKQTGLADVHARALNNVLLPDGVSDLPTESAAALVREGRESEIRRREHIGLIRKRLRDVDAAVQARTRAHDAKVLYADSFDDASESARSAGERLEEVAAELLAGWRRHANAAQVLRIPDFEDVLGSLEGWLGSLNGVNPMRAALDHARQLQEERFAARDVAISDERQELVEERSRLLEERHRLEAGEHQRPPVPYTRDATVRRETAGAPLWQLVDFAPHVSGGARAGLEAALEASGLLDAWVLPHGVVLDARTHDVLLTVRPACAGSLADWLVPTIPKTGLASAVDSRVLSALLQSVACGEREPGEAEAWVSPQGEFRLGSVRGAWTKPDAQYLGHAAREAARQARLAEIATHLATLETALNACESAATQLAVLRQSARTEYGTAPSDEDLLRSHAQRNAAEQQRRDAQVRLGEAESRLALSESALSRARDELALDARDLRLPAATEDIDIIEQALGEYRMAVRELANAIRHHQTALAELAEQIQREAQAHETLEFATADLHEKHKLLSAAIETVNTLQTTVGKQVDELLSEIEATETARQKHDRALKDARAALNAASAHRGTAEQKCTDLNEKLEERAHSRRLAIASLQAFAAETGFVVVAIPDLALPVGTATWGVDAALTVARRAEQALADVPAEEPDWDRIQRDVGRDFTELQSTMSAQGQSATAEPSDHGLIVRIAYLQRPERPDTLEQRLEAELAEQRLILSAQERSLLEEHLEKEIAANLQRMIRDTEERVHAINAELEKRPTSTGMRYRLVWEPLSDDAENAVAGLAIARKRLLNTSADAWSAEDRRQVGEFLQARIDAERQRDERGTLFESLARALDYRRWHHFSVERNQDKQWKPLSGPASSGERALGLTVPLFAAASSHYESSDARAPRLVLLDEAFAGIDDEARATCMGLIREFDLDFVMTSEREWGCYAELPGLNICQLVRREGMDAVFVSRWTWDGRERRAEEDPVRRFPEVSLAEE
jgi:uncharacterized protein (TIGR02680 family)